MAIPPENASFSVGSRLHLEGLRDVQQVGDVDLAPLQHRRSRGGIRDALEDEPLHRRHLAPVRLVGLHDQLDARRVAHELVGPQADRLLLEAVVADLLDVLLRHDPARAAHEGAVERHEVGPRLVQVKAHAIGIDDDHLPHLVVQDLRALGAVEAELHVLGGEGVAVVELQALAQLELVDALIRAHRPRLGQARGHEVAGHGLHERVVDRVEDPERGEAHELARIEPHRRQGHVERPAHLALGLRRRGLRLRPRVPGGAEGEHDAQQAGCRQERPREPGGGRAEVHRCSHARKGDPVRPMRGP